MSSTQNKVQRTKSKNIFQKMISEIQKSVPKI